MVRNDIKTLEMIVFECSGEKHAYDVAQLGETGTIWLGGELLLERTSPGKTRFFRVSHAVAVAPSTKALAFSIRLWPFGPHKRMDLHGSERERCARRRRCARSRLSLRSSHSGDAAEDMMIMIMSKRTSIDDRDD